MSTLADRTITALRANHDELAAMVGEFDEQDLACQSGSSQWDVAQVLSHLGSGAEIGLATLHAALADLPAPDREFNESVWDRWNALSPKEKAEGFLRTNEQLVFGYEGLDAKARSELRITMAFLPFPADVGLSSGMRLNEAALHAWDVRVAFDPQAKVSGREAGPALDQFAGPLSFLLGFLGKPETLGGIPATLRVESTDPDRVLGLVVSPSVSLGDVPGEVDGVLRGPAEALVRLFGGRLDPAHTPEALTLTSDVVTLDQLRRVFPGF